MPSASVLLYRLFKQRCRTMRNSLLFFFLGTCAVVTLFSCSASKQGYTPYKKYGRNVLREDYTLLRNILEKKHPSLYWYTSKDSMDSYFNQYYQAIADSMTEPEFGWKILAPLTDKIHCGHTSFGMSKAYNRWASGRRFASFPLFMKIWNDTMVVTGNMNRKDSIFKRGMIVTAINGQRPQALVNTLFGYMTEDGYANNVNYLRLSTNFPYYHRQVYGLSKNYVVNYLDSAGKEQKATIPYYDPAADSLQRNRIAPLVKISRKERKERARLSLRSLTIDTAGNTGIITLNTFSGGHLRRFFRRSFRTLSKLGIGNVVLDIRGNGGGKIGMSTLLTKYISRRSFKIADSATVAARSLKPYTRYIKGKFINNLGLFFFAKRKADGRLHFGFWERKVYHPKSRYHFDGDVYVLINGPTFSASTLFCNAVKGQPGITLVGEEAGGGWHGNSGVMIPDITLPNTKLRVRLPLVRIVQYRHVPKTGQGVPPDVFAGPSYEALVKGYDKKMEVVKALIKSKLPVRP